MNTILLQKILDILKEGLAHVGDFFKDLFVSDPQDGQVIAYDAETGHWINKDATEVELDLINTFEAQTIATLTDGAENVPMKSLVVDIVAQQGQGTPSPSSPLPITGFTGANITHTQIEAGTTATTYEPYTGTTYPISWQTEAGTVYGGWYDVTTGKLVVTHGSADMGTLSWSSIDNDRFKANVSNIKIASIRTLNILCPIYKSNIGGASLEAETIYNGSNENSIIVVDSSYNRDTNAFTTAMNGILCVYPLATPIEYTLTPTTIKTRGGTESIFADCGDVSGEYYTKTAENVLALANITEDITSDITKNTTDFSDILLKVSQNNKVVSVEIYSATTSAAVNATFLSNLPKPAMNSKVLLVNTTLGEDGTILGTLKTTGDLAITTSGAKTFSGLITYVAK